MIGVVVPIGPSDREVRRARAVLTELALHERKNDIMLVLVDDAPQPRDLSPDWPGAHVIRTAIAEAGGGDPFSAMVAGTIDGLRTCRDHGATLAVKLDTDAAVIGPFSEHLRRTFDNDPGLGVVGSYDVTSTGGIREFGHWPRLLRLATMPITVTRGLSGAPQLAYKRRTDRATVRRLRTAALSTAPPGAHCMGGAYAVSDSFLHRAELNWSPWVRTHLGEDVVVGVLCSAAGLKMKSLTGPSEPFGLAWQGLPAAPAELRARGHSIVHSVKMPTEAEERILRDQLAGVTRARPTDETPHGD
jgi:hypothetical protein